MLAKANRIGISLLHPNSPGLMADPPSFEERLAGAFPPPGRCLWPSGNPGTPGFRFCGERAMPGEPYCAAHFAAAHVPPSKREVALKQIAWAAGRAAAGFKGNPG